LRSLIALVSQDIHLFPGTIAENIGYGAPEPSLDEVINAAKAANAHDFIMELPKGYNTIIGEDGARLSGGEKQRISIARAILKDAPILLLDEPTSALDTQSEALVQEVFNKIMKNKTVIVIAHRLSTIKECDRVLVLDQGTIMETGSHEELLLKDGVYKKLYNKQVAFCNSNL
jgi:subfamily B ATP-binding cassette protein MsbA/ATP-binding cassette subfamily B protein AbcA/BmrA